jgi:hypothetical protein
MGEVYRTDDLKHGRAVALRFLPPKLAEDSVHRVRLFAFSREGSARGGSRLRVLAAGRELPRYQNCY